MTTQRLDDPVAISQIEQSSSVPARNQLVLWGFVVMFLGAAIGVVGKMLIHADSVTVIGILVSLVGMFLTVYPYLAPARPSKKESSPSHELPAQSPPKSLHEGSAEYIPSITERTTDLLKTKRQ